MNKKYLSQFAQEILLYSGQFALFYIIMQIILQKSLFFSSLDHSLLVLALVIQTHCIITVGHTSMTRFFCSLIAPAIYSMGEIREGFDHILNAAHIGFWIYAAISCFFYHLKQHPNPFVTQFSEVLTVLLNVSIFIFLYFYLDLFKDLRDQSALTINNIFSYTNNFLNDITHHFIIIGGCILAMTVALGRLEILRLKNRIFQLFGTYVDQNIRNRILQEDVVATDMSLCILFSDIKNFTYLCENASAIDVTKMLNIYFEHWHRVVSKHNGVVDKYIGDAIMVIFGLEGEARACESAVAAALDFEQQWPMLLQQLQAEKLPTPEGFGVGCHFGKVILGDIGSQERKNHTVIGDTVNIAARLESMTREEDCVLAVSANVIQRLPPAYRQLFQASAKLTVLHGKTTPTALFCKKSS